MECTTRVEAMAMDEQKEPTETTEQTETPTGAFAGMDFEEPDEQELYGFAEESEEEAEEAWGNPTFADRMMWNNGSKTREMINQVNLKLVMYRFK